MPGDFVKTTVDQNVNVMQLTLPEQVDSDAFDQLNQAVLKALDGRTNQSWMMDLSSVDYMGSSVLGLMVNLRQHIKSGGGQLVVCNLSPQLRQIFHTCCLERLFNITKDRNDARKFLRA
jgi:stage II sporulation protein AA (anti-sigma F factor antagonist)